MLVLVCVCTCVHVRSRASFSLSPCVCARACARTCVLLSPSWFLRKLHCWQSAGWLAGHLLFIFIFIFFSYENRGARAPRGATATEATPLGCVEMNRVLFNEESRELLYICKVARAWVFCLFSFDLAVEWNTAKSPKLGKQEVPLGATVCLFIYVFWSKWLLVGTSEYLLNFMLAFSLVWMGTDSKVVFNDVMSQKQKNCVPPFLCNQVWEIGQKVR